MTKWQPIALFLVGLILLLVLFIAHDADIGERATRWSLSWWLRTSGLQLSTTLMILGLTLSLVQLPPFRNYLEAKLTEIVSQRLDEDPSFLHDTFSTEKLKRISMNALTAVSSGYSLEAIRELYTNIVFPLVDATPRYDVKFEITDEVLITSAGDSAIRRIFTQHWTYRNSSSSAVKGSFPIWLSLQLLPGVDPLAHLEEVSYEIDGGVEVTKEDLKT